MPLFATFTFACLGLSSWGNAGAIAAPQDPAPKLAPGDLKTLQAKLSKMVETQIVYDDPTTKGKAREKAEKAYYGAKDAFWTDWKRHCEKQGDLLKSIADLEVIFANAWPYERKQPLSLRKFEAKDPTPAYWLSVPKSYKAESPNRAMLLVPGLDEKQEWTDGKKWFDSTWTEKSALVGDTVVHIPVVAKAVDLDAVPDYSKDGAEAQENQRIEQIFQSFGETQRGYNVDRARRFVDAGKGSSGFVVRLACHFPDVFTGLILRSPPPADALRLGSLGGVNVLLLSTAETAAACEAFKARLDKVEGATCTILAATDAYPFSAAAPEIEKWMAGCKRVVNRSKIVIEPLEDRFKQAYWVSILDMSSVHTAPEGAKPRVAVEADRAQNRIKVTAVGVDSLVLSLNDSLVDLDKPISLVVNDKAWEEGKRNRDFTNLLKRMIRKNDTSFLFPIEFRVNVPKQEKKADEAGAQK